jgi:hypothetical protein
MATLIIIGIVLYVDRVVRQEIIFDSSALTCTVFAMHVLNLCRSSIAHIDASHVQVQQQSLYNSFHHTSMPFNASSHHQQHSHHNIPGVPWQHTAILVAYSFASILLLLDIDMAGLAIPGGRECIPAMMPIMQQQQQPTEEHSHHLRASTIVLHCLLVGCVLQVPVSQAIFVLPWKIIARSFTFALLSIFWTYAVGIHHASIHMRSYPYYYNPVLQKKYVQPFTPCQLRFLVVLLLDGWLLLATAACMACITTRHLSSLLNSISSSSSTATMVYSPPKLSHHTNNNWDPPVPPPQPAASVPVLSPVIVPLQNQKLTPTTATDSSSATDVATMFRMAQRAAQQRGIPEQKT